MMQSKWNRIQSGTARGTWVALLSVLIVMLFAATASVAQGPPATPVLVSQVTWYPAFPTGGVLAEDADGGSSWGINSKGVIVAGTTYGGQVIQFAGPGYAVTEAGPVGNVGGIAIDSNDNLYVGDQYNSVIAKIAPNTDGTYTIATDPTKTSAPPACDGVAADDTAAGECVITAPGTSLGYFGVTSMVFDKAGDLFFATDDQGSNPYTIYECSSTCLYGATPTAPVLIYAEPISTTVSTTGQLFLGGMAFDPWGNLFFTDAAVVASGNGEDASSNLNELAYTASSKTFSATTSVLATFNDPTPLAHYNDSIDTLYIDPTLGTVYFALQNGGIFAMPNTKSGGVNMAGLYGVTSRGAKLMKADTYGNILFVGYDNDNNADTLGYISFGGPTFPVTSPATTTASLIVADNTEPCTPTLSLTSSDSEYAAVAGSCGGMALGTGSFVPVTVTFTPGTGVIVPPTAALTVTDTTSSASTSVAVRGSALSVDQPTWLTAYTSGGAFGGDSAGGTSGAINSKGVVVVGSSYGNGILEFTQGGTVVTNIGNTHFGGAGAMLIDSQDYLYASNEYGNLILKLPMNTDGTGTYPAIPATAALLAKLPTCAGDGVAPDSTGICQMSPGALTIAFGIASMAFDNTGNMFIATDDESPSTTLADVPFSIIECSATCLYGATPGDATTDTQPVVLFTEPGPDANGDELYIGAVAVDAAENVYFTDDLLDVNGNGYNHYSDLYQLPYDSGTSTYAATPTLLENLTPACGAPPCDYNNELDSVATDASGNIFFADQYTGIYEYVNNSGSYDFGSPIAISGKGAKIIIPDGTGSFYFVSYDNDNSGDTLGYDLIGKVNITGEALPTSPTTATINVIDNFDCVASPQLTFSFDNPDFTVPATAPTCADLAFGGASSFSQTITFTPGASDSGTISSTMTATDTTNGGSGTATVTAQAATAQPITGFAGITSPVVYGSGPYTLSANTGAAGNAPVFTIDASSTAAATINADGSALTITGVGTLLIDVNEAGGVVGGVTYAPGYLQVSIEVDQATQTITGFNPPSTVYVGATPITLSATGGASGSPVTFTLDSTSTAGAATLSGSTLTITGAGTVVIDANQDGNTDYAAAAQVQASIVVSAAAPQAITFAPASPVAFGVAPITLTATGGASGSPVTFTLDSTSTAGAATLSGSTLTITGVGTVVIDANQAGGVAGGVTYAAAPQVQASIVVTQATQTITFTNPAASESVTFGVAPIVLAATASSTLPVTFSIDSTSTAGAATLGADGVTLTIAAAGTVVIDANQAGNANYAAATQAQITITVNPLAPTFTITASPTTATVTSGTPAKITITVAPNATFTGTVSFACTGTGVTCAFSPATVTAPTTTTTLTISKGTTAALHNGPNPFLPAGATFAIALGFLGWKKRRSMFLAVVLLAGILGMMQLTACGGSSSKTSTVTVTATSGSITQTLPLTITVK